MADWTIKELQEWDDRICEVGKTLGLDWYEISYEILDYYEMIGAMSNHGLPSHYSHWSFGKSFESILRKYNAGESGLPYEMIINSDPSVAYLMRENPAYLQILIMAHCVGHSDFFKNNDQFKHTNARNVITTSRNAKRRIQEYIEDPSIGIEQVERVLDACHAIGYHVEMYGRDRVSHSDQKKELVTRVKNDVRKEYVGVDVSRIPLRPDYDVLGFMVEHGNHLEDWERDVIGIVRDESVYFMPQIRTKILNEGWACVSGNTRIDTDAGLMRAKDLVKKKFAGSAYDGESYKNISGWYRNQSKRRVKITTDFGFEIHGGDDHKIFVNGEWKKLKEVVIGDEIEITRGNNVWPTTLVDLPADIVKFREDPDDILKRHNVSSYVLSRVRNGLTCKKKENVKQLSRAKIALQEFDLNKDLHYKSEDVTFPDKLTPALANILGMMIGDGALNETTRRITGGLTSGDDQLKDLFFSEVLETFGVECHLKRDENRWRVMFPRVSMIYWLKKMFNLTSGPSAHIKKTPEQIFYSPREVVVSYLRGLYDTGGCATKDGGVIFSTTSKQLSKDVQELLLKFGILSRRKKLKKSSIGNHPGYSVSCYGIEAEHFRTKIGFNLTRKQERLDKKNESRLWFNKSKNTMIVNSIKEDVGETFDFGVEDTHAYRASAFKNHNCWVHKKIMNMLDLPQKYHIPFLKSHNQVVRPFEGEINPYHVGLYIFDRIEQERGFQECLFTREVHHDESAIREFIDERACHDLGLFTYSLKKGREGSVYTIDDVPDEEGWRDIRENLVRNVGLNRIPKIYVENLEKSGEVVLRHDHDGRDLQLDYATNVVNQVRSLWRRPVKFMTVIEDEPFEI